MDDVEAERTPKELEHDANVTNYLYNTMRMSVSYGNAPLSELLYDLAKDSFHVADFPNSHKNPTGLDPQERFLHTREKALSTPIHQLFSSLYDGYKHYLTRSNPKTRKDRLEHLRDAIFRSFSQSSLFTQRYIEGRFRDILANIEGDSWHYEELIEFMLEEGIKADEEILKNFTTLPEGDPVRNLIEQNWQRILDPHAHLENHQTNEL